MLLKAEFKPWAVVSIILLVLVNGYLINTIFIEYFHSAITIPFYIYSFIVAFTLTCLWLVFVELRTKILRIQISDKSISSTNYFGLGNSKTFTFDQIDGFKTSLLQSYSGSYEYFYILVGGNRVIKVSEFYHLNYIELKRQVSSCFKYLGKEDYKYSQEFKDLFV